MKNLTICLLALGLVACADIKPQSTNINSLLDDHVESFIYEASIRGIQVNTSNLVVQLGDLPNGKAGVCRLMGKEKTIIISQKIYAFYMGLNMEFVIEELVFHELGHCLLNKMHRDEIDERGHERSIMSPYIIVEDYYMTYRKQYLDELFLNIDVVFN